MKTKLALVLCAVFVATLAAVSYVRLATDTTGKLCQVLATRISASSATLGQPGSAGYFYYQAHPGELAQARRDTKDLLDSLPC